MLFFETYMSKLTAMRFSLKHLKRYCCNDRLDKDEVYPIWFWRTAPNINRRGLLPAP